MVVVNGTEIMIEANNKKRANQNYDWLFFYAVKEVILVKIGW